MTEISEFMKLLFSLSFSGTVLFLIVLCLLMLCRDKVSRRWQYYIFLLVIFRFLIPFPAGDTLTGRLFGRVGENGYFGEMLRAQEVPGYVSDSDTAADADGGTDTGRITDTDKNGEVDAEHTEAFFADSSYDGQKKTDVSVLWTALFFVWGIITLALILRKITVYQSYLHFLKKGNVEVADIGILNLLSEKEEEMRIKRRIELYQNPLLASPMMTGFFHPQIIIPSTESGGEELAYVFAHELVHYKYSDMFYKWLVQITICIHWFNPFVYLLGRQINKNCELACDEKVIRTMDTSDRKKYGDTLLSFLETEKKEQNPLASLTLTEGAGQLIERLGAIMDYKRKSVKIIVFTIFLTLAIAVCSAALGVYAEQKTDSVFLYDENTEDGYYDEGEADEIDVYDKIIYEDKDSAYYILTEGTTMEDKPTGGFVGGFGVVLVRKSGYAALGPFSRRSSFVNEIEAECLKAFKDGKLSQAEADIICKAAKEIEDSGFSESEIDWPSPVAEYAYIQRAFYRAPYIIEMGWNMREQWFENEPVQVPLEAIPDVSVYFSSRVKQYAANQDVTDRVTELVTSIQESVEEGYEIAGEKFALPIESLYVVNVIYLPPEEIEDWAKNACKDDDIVKFAYVAEELSDEVIADYAEKFYMEDNLSFFAVLMDAMPKELRKEYCKRAYEEDNADFYSMLIDELPQEEIDRIAQECYEKEDTMYFSITEPSISEEMRQKLLKRARKDKNTTFYYMLENAKGD